MFLYRHTLSHPQSIRDWHLFVGVLTLVLIDLVILITFITVEAVHGNLKASRFPNRENPMDVNGVGFKSNCHPVQMTNVHSREIALK